MTKNAQDDSGSQGYRWLWPVLIAVFVVFSLASSFYELSRSGDLRPNREFELIHNFPTDYNFYLSRIREGLEGRWTVVEKYTSEVHKGSFIHGIYLLMGKAGAHLRVPLGRAGDIYHIARIVLGATLLWATVMFCVRSFSAKRFSGHSWPVFAFLFAVTASSWPKLTAVVHGSIVPATGENILQWRFGGYMAWWSVMDSLQRITFIPHILVGQALIVVLVLLVTNTAILQKNVNLILAGLLAFALGMIFPPGLIFVYAVMGIWVVLSGKPFRQLLVPYGAIVMISVPSLVYLFLMTGMYPWKRLAEVDIIRPLPFDYAEYFRAMGPMLPLGVMGAIVALLVWESAMLPAIAWILAWGILLGIFAFIPQQSPLRFSEMIPHVPLGVLSGYLFYRLGKYVPKHITYFMMALLIFTGVFHMYSSFLWQRDFVDHKIRATLPLVPTGSYVMYPLKDFTAAIRYLEDTTRGSDAVILSETTAGNYIPVLSGNFVYAGHDNTVAFEGKREKVREFFSGRMNKAAAKTWAEETRASYVFYGPQEREDGGGSDLRVVYPFLIEVYKNPAVTVYRIE